jgi:ABC-2 type transport system ATP-binding protein
MERRGATEQAVAVRVEDLHKTYVGGVQAVRGLWFDVHEGEIFGLLGPNGAGKSTTLGVLTTVVRPTRGRALVAGHDVRTDAIAVRRSIGVVFQDSVLDNEFSGGENLRLHARLWRMSRGDARRRIDELLSVMGLVDRAGDNVRTYSGGMRRRLEIARALLAGPRVIFLDEPTTGLDPAIRDAVWQLIERLRRDEGVTIVLSTHYLEEAEGVCDRVAIIDRGRLVAHGRPGALVERLGPELVELRVEADPGRAARALADTGLGSQPPLIRGDVVALPVRDGADQLGARVGELSGDGLAVVGSTIRRSTLADVFAHLTGQTNPDGEDEPA